MKLASLKSPNNRDGQLIVVDRNLQYAVKVPDIANSLIIALENWKTIEPQLTQVYRDLNQSKRKDVFPVEIKNLASPLPRSPQWLDASAYLPHVRRVRKSRGAEMPESFLIDPLMYQGASDTFLAPHDNIELLNSDWGLDFEAELAVVTDDVGNSTSSKDALSHIKLLMLVNDISLRNLIPSELAKGFGFIQGKPSSSFSPVAITPDELGEHWIDGKCFLTVTTLLNNHLMGKTNAGEDMQFSFPELISHAAKSRKLSAGTILGSGTISNTDETNGVSCLVEKRVLEIISTGTATTPYLVDGDLIKIDMQDNNGKSIFGTIEQKVKLIK